MKHTIKVMNCAIKQHCTDDERPEVVCKDSSCEVVDIDDFDGYDDHDDYDDYDDYDDDDDDDDDV